jgi:predicted adenine nucleotide alpha hydrolase (AANH) superfamily ATPase
MKALVHCCCAPCSVSVVNSLRGENTECDLFWYNPNIHLYNEYKSRRDCLKEFAVNESLKLAMIDEYGVRSFLDAVYPDTGNRCEKCYLLRMEKTASYAAQEGYKAFTTTLLISPYQNHEAVKQIGKTVGEKYGIDYLYRDFRPLFRAGQSEARSRGYYMQKYCGCIFSEEERYLKSG